MLGPNYSFIASKVNEHIKMNLGVITRGSVEELYCSLLTSFITISARGIFSRAGFDVWSVCAC